MPRTQNYGQAHFTAPATITHLQTPSGKPVEYLRGAPDLRCPLAEAVRTVTELGLRTARINCGNQEFNFEEIQQLARQLDRPPTEF
jgi:hypothetical protein